MGFPLLTLGSPFLLSLITRAPTLSQPKIGKCFVTSRLRKIRHCFSAAKMKLFPVRELPAAPYDVLVLRGSVAFGLFIIVHASLWGCGVLVSMGFCSAALILEQKGLVGPKLLKQKSIAL